MKKVALGIALAFLMTNDANAANFAMITSPPTMFSFFVLVIAGFCLVGSFQILNQVRGGLLSRSWQMFFIGFVLLAISQLGHIAASLEILMLPVYFMPGVLVLMAGVFAYGVYNARRTLS
jgi:predicted membrane channel-forming protein YqfA (hemolysin III family)